MNKNHKPKLNWSITPWQMNGRGGWITQPVILVEGQTPFFADKPDDYILKLQELHDDTTIARGPFYVYIGQLQDSLEQFWNTQEVEIASSRN